MTEEKGKEEGCCSDKSAKGCGCGSGGCGCGSGCGRGAGCRCFKAFLLVLLGLIAGYFLSRRCQPKGMMCDKSGQMSHMQCPVAGDAATPAAK